MWRGVCNNAFYATTRQIPSLGRGNVELSTILRITVLYPLDNCFSLLADGQLAFSVSIKNYGVLRAVGLRRLMAQYVSAAAQYEICAPRHISRSLHLRGWVVACGAMPYNH